MPVDAPAKTFGQWKILVICPNPSLAGELAPLLSEYLRNGRTNPGRAP